MDEYPNNLNDRNEKSDIFPSEGSNEADKLMRYPREPLSPKETGTLEVPSNSSEQISSEMPADQYRHADNEDLQTSDQYQQWVGPPAPGQDNSEYRWSKPSEPRFDSSKPGRTNQPGHRYDSRDQYRYNESRNKSGVKAVVVVIAIVLVVLAVAFVAVLGTLAYMRITGRVDNNDTGQEPSGAVVTIEGTKALETEQFVSNAPDPDRNALDIDSVDPSESTASGQLQTAAEKVIPSVVLVREYQSGATGLDNSTNLSSAVGTDFNSNQHALQFGGDTDVIVGEGSGVIMTKEGHIVTNAHVVTGGNKYEIVTYDGTSFEATLLGADVVTDLAVLQVDPGETELTPATFSGTSALRVADQVIAVGNPAGSILSSTVTVGYISALNRMIMADDGSNMNYIQTDAAINSGNSGGALANLNGEVIGINTLKVAGDTYEGLGFAIPWDMAEPIVQDLAQFGEVQNRPALGVRGNFMNSAAAIYYRLPNTGFYIAEVINKDLLSEGIEEGCIITAIDGINLVSSSTLSNYLAQKKPGDEVNLDIVNSLTGSSFSATVVLIDSHGVN